MRWLGYPITASPGMNDKCGLVWLGTGAGRFGDRPELLPKFIEIGDDSIVVPYCWMCECIRPSEAFSSRNRRRHLCRECARRPQAERDRKQRLRSLWEMLVRQSNISKKNIETAATWTNDADPEVATLAALVVEVGQVHPHRRRRRARIRSIDPGLFQRMITAGLVSEWPIEWDAPEPSGRRPSEKHDPYSVEHLDDGDDVIPF
ncbi:MAG TPA: hypothetical protein VFH68_18895 [Polyangia bacterium]|jgi:hypothetical protein|nr:hypothetical protein [Polyangia bacterium]